MFERQPVSLSYSINRDDTIPSTGRTFNATTLHMHIFTSWKLRKVEQKALQKSRQRAKARSDEIDLRLEEEAKSSRRLYNVLLMSSCPHLVIYVFYVYNLHWPARYSRIRGCSICSSQAHENCAWQYPLARRCRWIPSGYMENPSAKFTSYCYGHSKSEFRVYRSLKQSKLCILYS